MDMKEIFNKTPFIHGLGMEFAAYKREPKPERALTSFTVCDAYRYFLLCVSGK